MGPFAKYKMWRWGSPPNFWKFKVKFPILNANISAPKRFGEEILVHRMQNSQESSTYKADGGGSLPEFLAIFFVILFGLKNFKGAILKIISSFFA